MITFQLTIIPIYNTPKNWGFKVPNEIKRFNDINGVISFNKKWEEKDILLPFEIDGIVIKVDDVNIRKKWDLLKITKMDTISYKFRVIKVSTILNKITYQVGRTGFITPCIHCRFEVQLAWNNCKNKAI